MKTIGRAIKALRQKKEWTLAQLAKQSGVALSSLSRMETGRMTGTLESHMRIARAFGIRLPELYTEIDPAAAEVEVHRASEEGRKLLEGAGAGFTILTDRALTKKMLPMLLSLKAGKSTKPRTEGVGSERFLYLVKGELEVESGTHRLRLSAGDSAYLPGPLSHRFTAVGRGPALVLSVTAPPDL